MKIREQVMKSFAGRTMTWDMGNREIARSIDRPEPSVRRVTAALTKEGILKPSTYGKGMHGERFYQMTPAGRAKLAADAMRPMKAIKRCGDWK